MGNLLRELYTQYDGASGDTNYVLQGRVQGFQTLQDPLAPVVSPYRRVPQVTATAFRQGVAGRVDVSLPAEYVRFTHDSLVEGTRVSLNPSVALPFQSPGYFVVPKIGVHYADYRLARAAPLAIGFRHYPIHLNDGIVVILRISIIIADGEGI